MADPLHSDFMTELRERFPTYGALFGHFPEIDELLRWAIEELDPDNVSEFEYRLRETEFFKSRSDTARNWDTESLRDPGTARERRKNRRETLLNRASAYGITIPQHEIENLVETSLRWGFTEQELTDSILDAGQGQTGIGSLTATGDDLQTLARDYLLSIPPGEARRLAEEIERGHTTAEAIQAQFRREAGASFPQFREALDSGLTIRDATSSIRSHVANTLGMAPEMVDFNNDRWTDLIDHVGDDGQRRMMTRAEAGRWARQQTEYGKTEQARQVASGIVASVGQIMGKHA